MLRTFLALTLDDASLDAVASLTPALRMLPELARARWIERQALHVTLRFLGATDEALVPDLAHRVAELGRSVEAPIALRSRSLLAFPTERRAHVVGLRLEPSAALEALAARAESASVALGFTPETRELRPHLTLARIRKTPADLRRVVAEQRLSILGRATSITLFKSETVALGAATYAPLAAALLPAELHERRRLPQP